MHLSQADAFTSLKHLSRVSLGFSHSVFAASWIRLRSTLLNNLIVIRSIRHAGKGAKWGLRSARSSSDEGGSRSGESESVFDQFVFSL